MVSKAERVLADAERKANREKELKHFRNTTLKAKLFEFMADVAMMRDKLNMKCDFSMFYRTEQNSRVGEKAEVVVRFDFNMDHGFGLDTSDEYLLGLETAEEWELEALATEMQKQRDAADEERKRQALVDEAKSLLSDDHLQALGLRR